MRPRHRRLRMVSASCHWHVLRKERRRERKEDNGGESHLLSLVVSAVQPVKPAFKIQPQRRIAQNLVPHALGRVHIIDVP